MELLRSFTDTVRNTDLKNLDGVIALTEHDRIWHRYLDKDVAFARGFLPGTAAQFRTLQSRRDDRRLLPRSPGIHALR